MDHRGAALAAIDARIPAVLVKIRDGLDELIAIFSDQPQVAGQTELFPSRGGDEKPRITNAFIRMYCDAFKKKYNTFPPISGKDTGITKRISKSFSPERYQKLLDAYFAMPDAQLVKAKHPLNLFEMKLNEIAVFGDSGKFTTNTQAREVDQSVALKQQLDRIEKREI